MTDFARGTRSIWWQDSDPPELLPVFTPSLLAGGQAEICVVGAGIAGLTTAFLLAREGRRVLVLDKEPTGAGETGNTTAHLSNAWDDWFHVLEDQHGPEAAALTAESHTAAIDMIERLVREESIECDFARVDGYLFLAPGTKPDALTQELEASHRAGLGDVAWHDRLDLPGGTVGPALRYPRQAQFHPLNYLRGIAQALRRRGGVIARGRVVKIDAGERVTLTLDDGASFTAAACAVCTNSPIVDKVSIHTKQVPWRSYAVALKLPRGAVPPSLWWDTEDAYHYVRTHSPANAAHDVLIAGGEDHRTGEDHDAGQRLLRLENWARRFWPMAGERLAAWSGQVMEPADGLAFIGRDPANRRNVLIATGDSGMGMTHGTIAGLLLTDLVQERPNEWAKLYDPARKPPPRSMLGWVKDNLGTAREFARDHLGLIDQGEKSATGIAAGEGAIVVEEGAKLAIHRRADGSLVRLSALCTHLGCVVHWNGMEKSWDCPCHGSRFAATGEVLNGPAVSSLKPADEDAS
jgi:glycine/D-amino acid oxidase-like deaminating enzyme/nitrite reductase/ring-hydroxylating ferredoxin subunit